MNDTLPGLQNQLPERIVEILRLVTTAADKLSIRAFVVGATARDLIFGHLYNVEIRRATADIDFGIAVENWAQYERLKQSLIETKEFRDDNKAEHRLWRGQGADAMKIDLVPYGDLESLAGQIAFPPGDFVMNTHGFAEAYQDSLIVRLSADLTVRVASLAGLAVLKFIAYNDKPHERKKDLQDIFFAAKNYLEAGNEERLFGEAAADADLVENENFDYRTAGARLLGRDMAKLLIAQTKEIVFKHLAEDRDDTGLSSVAETIKSSEGRLADDLAEIIEMLRQLKQGIVERLPE